MDLRVSSARRVVFTSGGCVGLCICESARRYVYVCALLLIVALTCSASHTVQRSKVTQCQKCAGSLFQLPAGF